MSQPTAKVIAYTCFVGVPEELQGSGVAANQDQGTDAERLVECAGRTCYDSYGRGRASTDYHRHILEVGHGSVLEHASLSFFLSGLSRGCTHELIRHRVGTAISQRSTRYVDESAAGYAWHPLIYAALRKDGPGIPLRREKEQDQRLYDALVKLVQEHLESLGVDPQTARKQARGAARGALGNALETELVWTANLRALRNVIEQRASRHADAEIRLLANALYEAALPYCPAYLSDYKRRECPDGIGYELVTEHLKV